MREIPKGSGQTRSSDQLPTLYYPSDQEHLSGGSFHE